MEVDIKLIFELPTDELSSLKLNVILDKFTDYIKNGEYFSYHLYYCECDIEIFFKIVSINNCIDGYSIDSGCLNFDIKNMNIKYKNSTIKESSDLIKEMFIRDCVEMFIWEFIYASTLTYPYYINFYQFNIEICNNKSTFKCCSYLNSELLYLTNDYKFHRSLDLKDVLAWINKVLYSDLFDDKVKIAFNSFTYLWNVSNYDDFLYSIIGIESIYNINKQESIIAQIKSGVNNNLNINLNKQVDEIYNFRSRFMHGDLYFSPKHLKDVQDIDKSFNKKFENISGVTFYILIASLQKLIHNG